MAVDHHHNVPVRLQIDEKSTRQKFIPIDRIFTLINEQHQFLAHCWTIQLAIKNGDPWHKNYASNLMIKAK